MRVTCVCPTTAARARFLERAIECFQAQTYSDRELLIVVEPGYAPAVPADERIRVIEAPVGLSLGSKRNFCNENAGLLVAHWDDDDWSEPERLMHQVERLQESGRAMTGYRFMTFTDGAKWWVYQEDADYVPDTSLMYRRDWWLEHPISPVAMNFDQIFIRDAFRAGQLDIVDCNDMMYATNHPGNTSPRNIGINSPSWRVMDPPAAFADHIFPEAQ